MEIETLTPGDYLARIDGREAAFTVP